MLAGEVYLELHSDPQERCPDLLKVLHDLKVFDDKYMDKEFFSLLPRPLIKVIYLSSFQNSLLTDL